MTSPSAQSAPSICVTIDYELFGHGAGDVQTHMIQPAERLLRFFSRTGIRATFFVEAAELQAFAQALQSGRGPASLARDYDALFRQLGQIVAEGHDIQLHVHPQWIGAGWRGGHWVLLSEDYDLMQWGMESLTRTLEQGRLFLEGIGRRHKPSYECRVFRAGGLCLDRSADLTNALMSCGIRLDSSVCRGYHRQSPYASVDYRDSTGNRSPYWRTPDGCNPGSAGGALWEVPVWAVQRSQWHKLTPGRLRSKLRRDVEGLERHHISTQAELPRNPVRLLSWLNARRPLMWDFCLMTGRQLIEAFEEALAFHPPSKFLPLVMIGHSKDVDDLSGLERFVSYASARRSAHWITMSSALDEILRAKSKDTQG